jgi:hypothetical protein
MDETEVMATITVGQRAYAVPGDVEREIQTLRAELDAAKERVEYLHEHLRDNEDAYAENVEAFRQRDVALAGLRIIADAKIARLSAETRSAILEMLRDLDTELAKPDDVDYTGIITTHMRAGWELRDRVNAYFDAMEKEPQ